MPRSSPTLWVALTAVACAPATRAPTVSPQDIPALEAERAKNPTDADRITRLGVAYYDARQYDRARDVLRASYALRPSVAAGIYLALSFEGLVAFDSAMAGYRRVAGLKLSGAERTDVENRLVLLTRERLRTEARRAVAHERELAAAAPEPNTIAVLPWQYLGADENLRPLERGVAHLVVTDLGKVSRLRLLEREQVQALIDELALAASDRVERTTAARSGRLLRAAQVVQGTVREVTQTANLRLDAAIVNTTTQSVAATGTASDRLQQLFQMEKQLVFQLLDRLGIALTAAERRAITERPTSDLQAFLAFSRGLEAEDRGNYRLAAQEFNAAVARDPNFQAARTRAASALRLSAAGGGTAARLVELARLEIPVHSGSPTEAARPSRLTTLWNGLAIVAPSSGSRLDRRGGERLPVDRSRLAEALRQDDASRIAIFGDIILVIPRPQ
ncbi:MAG: CsgG/HfaB family protein [Gemmatimonadota bacterium]